MKRGEIRINVDDIIGKRLGKLKITDYVGYMYDNTAGGKRLRHYYVCQCDCGETKTIVRSTLKNELAHSCGCSKRKKNN